eukprot:g33389.t1
MQAQEGVTIPKPPCMWITPPFSAQIPLPVHKLMSISDSSKLPQEPRFYLALVLRGMGLASLLQNAPSSWTVLYHLSFVEKFAKKSIFDRRSIRKWSARSVLDTLWEKER